MIRSCDWTHAEDRALLALLRGGASHRQAAESLTRAFGRAFSKDSVNSRVRRLRGEGSEIPVEVGLSEMRAPRNAIRPPAAETFDEEPGTEPFDRVADTDPAPPYVPHPMRGPAEKPHYIPDGHELGGVSRLTNANGDIQAEWSKTRVAGADEPPVPVPESFHLASTSIMRRADGSTVVQWGKYKQDEVDRWEAIKAAVVEHVVTYVRPVEPVAGPTECNADLLTIYPLGDPHIGMMAWAAETGENFDLKIGEAELVECMRQMVARSPASEQCIVANLGDFWHYEDDNQRTPQSGNKLDGDGRFGKVARVGLRILQSLIDFALTKHKIVRVRSLPGNHDLNSAHWIPEYLRAWYRNEPRVLVEDGYNPYQYDAFGKVLLGWCHGDGAKTEALGEIMATDVPYLWGASTFRYVHKGHIHHDTLKELRGCIVESHRTLAGRDAWHHREGYRSGRALKAHTYHREYGLDSTVVVGVERVRAALRAAA